MKHLLKKVPLQLFSIVLVVALVAGGVSYGLMAKATGPQEETTILNTWDIYGGGSADAIDGGDYRIPVMDIEHRVIPKQINLDSGETKTLAVVFFTEALYGPGIQHPIGATESVNEDGMWHQDWVYPFKCPWIGSGFPPEKYTDVDLEIPRLPNGAKMKVFLWTNPWIDGPMSWWPCAVVFAEFTASPFADWTVKRPKVSIKDLYCLPEDGNGYYQPDSAAIQVLEGVFPGPIDELDPTGVIGWIIDDAAKLQLPSLEIDEATESALDARAEIFKAQIVR